MWSLLWQCLMMMMMMMMVVWSLHCSGLEWGGEDQSESEQSWLRASLSLHWIWSLFTPTPQHTNNNQAQGDTRTQTNHTRSIVEFFSFWFKKIFFQLSLCNQKIGIYWTLLLKSFYLNSLMCYLLACSYNSYNLQIIFFNLLVRELWQAQLCFGAAESS